jgi:hypothetical protein
MLNDGPYAEEDIVIDALTRMALAYLGVAD